MAPKYIRKWFYNFLILNNVPESVADFIEGRAPESVGPMHYLANVKQADYWYGLILKTLEAILIN
ncbi:MAG: integrase [Thermoplasmataceae archaeon]